MKHSHAWLQRRHYNSSTLFNFDNNMFTVSWTTNRGEEKEGRREVRRGDEKSGKPLALDMDLIYLPASDNKEHAPNQHPLASAYLLWNTVYSSLIYNWRVSSKLAEAAERHNSCSKFHIPSEGRAAVCSRQRCASGEAERTATWAAFLMENCARMFGHSAKKYIQNRHEG